ncbi:uncharacterized protein B0P05DRAFT_534389 [Gilbertella persicaria]|uniref:uncharacterized protein n=1 Tax=Gilbertella persicaria TaxID=101096 RepID=UPI00221F067C|nr:uncharacterized protein B0P05DRAFT_534389 [Gilbertella persicaria]KAI8085962.1 hypothetical protein B0P05DRAFT_534389 [Gilbertella persicaria]
MSDQEEDDYMSLKFLEEAQEFESKRKETSYSERRKRQLREQEKKGYIKPRAQLEAEEREKGLQRSMDESNKGMKMLMKMGFKKGMSLGSNGIVEPIKVDLTTGRHGIGMKTEMKKRARELEEREEQERKKVAMDPEEFRSVMAQRVKEGQLVRYLTAAVSLCEKIDEENNVKSNILWLLKPIQKEEKEEDEVDKEQEKQEEPVQENQYPEEQVQELNSLTLDQKLQKVIDYLRDKYFYCFWCSAKYQDKGDLDVNCPGTEEEDH